MQETLTMKIGRIVLYVLLLLVFCGPFWGIAATAFNKGTVQPGQLVLWPQQPTFQHFVFAWVNVKAWLYLFNSLVVVIIGTALQTTVSALAAYALARKTFRGAGIVSLAILSTMMLPDEVIAIPLYLILHARLPVLDVSLYNSYAGMILPIVGWAFSVFLLTEFMKAIPRDLEDAARVDGASELQIFRLVVLPLVKPALGTTTIFGFLMIWDQYLLPLIAVDNRSLYTIPVILRSLRVDEIMQQNIFIAFTVIATIPCIVVYLLLQRHFNRGLMSGAVKG
ncbi:Binding-protein-dependent transport systems inner membrane component [uncultured Pleomorphomonas sp.]|uniref:Sugar ABC transporter permease n=2 Tax=Pleomorphomonas TaxID=261933 RepID=A0A2G9X040_9HYPH|nr:carbohydrate ABC transporter permease [Pleomorphomonas carboxyditropha]PIP00274.1 sugar ABC transporter permease [Pleomorphomonas carboxyditropha]SCM76124.1 Binding-protein-dependent transport systems inner membrane component [uncultured Pleomorphomonas sp.]